MSSLGKKPNMISKIKQHPQTCAVTKATGAQAPHHRFEQMERHFPSLVESEGEDIAVGCWESTGLKAVFAAPGGRFSKATSWDRGTEATGNNISLEF